SPSTSEKSWDSSSTICRWSASSPIENGVSKSSAITTASRSVFSFLLNVLPFSSYTYFPATAYLISTSSNGSYSIHGLRYQEFSLEHFVFFPLRPTSSLRRKQQAILYL